MIKFRPFPIFHAVLSVICSVCVVEAQTAGALTVRQVIELSAIGTSDRVLQKMIRDRGVAFTPSDYQVEQIMTLPQKGVSKTIVEELQGRLLQTNENDPAVLRAKQNLDQLTRLVDSGVLSRVRLEKVQLEVEDALDMSLLKKGLSIEAPFPEQVDQMVFVSQRMASRRQRLLLEMQQMAAGGAISQAEAAPTETDIYSAKTALDLAEARVKLIEQLASNLRQHRPPPAAKEEQR